MQWALTSLQAALVVSPGPYNSNRLVPLTLQPTSTGHSADLRRSLEDSNPAVMADACGGHGTKETKETREAWLHRALSTCRTGLTAASVHARAQSSMKQPITCRGLHVVMTAQSTAVSRLKIHLAATSKVKSGRNCHGILCKVVQT